MGFKKLSKENIELEKFKNEPVDNSTIINTHIDTYTDMHFPWEEFNKNAVKPKKQFILKLIEYYHSALHYLSNPEEGESMQKIVNDILIPELDKKIKNIK
jgi:hypothetical protein